MYFEAAWSKAGNPADQSSISVAIRLIMIIMIYSLVKVIASNQGMFSFFKGKEHTEINGITSIFVLKTRKPVED